MSWDRFKLDAGNRLKYKGESERLNLGIELDYGDFLQEHQSWKPTEERK
jgi:hypothetical protein